jgi:integrase
MPSLPCDFPDAEASCWQQAAGPIPWGQFTAEFLELYTPPLRAKGTFKKMRYTLDQMTAFGLTSTEQLTVPTIARFIATRPETWSANTTYSLMAAVRSACNYAAAQGYCRVSPFAVRKHWVRRCEPKTKQHHSREEIARVLTQMKEEIDRKRSWSQWRARRLYALAATVAYTGLRKSEALHLRVEDVGFAERMLFIRSRSGNRLKTERSAAPVPMPDALVSILADWVPHLVLPSEFGGPVTGVSGPMPESNPRGIRDAGWVFPNAYRTGPWIGGSPGHRPLDRMKTVAKRAGVTGFTFLSLRHSWATHAEYWGLSDVMIQRVLRHTNTQTQHHYRHADADNMRAKARGIGFGHDLAATEADSSAAPAPQLPPPLLNSPGRPMASWPKLDDADAVEMRRLRAGGWSLKDLAKRFGVSKSTVHYTLHFVIHREATGEGNGS